MKREEQLALKKAEYTGKVYPSNKYGDVEIVEYINNKRAIIKFINTGYTVEENWSAIRSGYIRDRSLPTTCGFGYIDIEGASIGRNMTKEYQLWNNMINRCYNSSLAHIHPTYKDCHVSEGWRYLSKFKEWYFKQIGFDQVGWQLDKDILVKGNKVYSEETCCFVPSEINTLLVKRNSLRGEFPIGVGFYKPLNKYVSRLSTYGKARTLGYFSSVEEAFYVYKEAKEIHIKEVANKWKDQIDPRVYEALMGYQVEITD